ncbi:type II secretion system protein GspK [Pendulispora brunnea]|uniref:Type II secretion system protein GspK n=1 Tax=Pendulispora brunnea TaxID=2905690 RepID=A0ABZ2KLK0_9BACT
MSAHLAALAPARRRRAKQRARERGIALIMVLGAIAVLTVMLAEFQDETSTELAAALADRDGVQAEYMARSAVNLSRLLLAAEPTMRTAVAPLFMMMKKTPPQLPVWEFSDRILGAFNDQEGAASFAGSVGVDLSAGKNLGMPGGRFEISIVDEDSKINVNLGAANDMAHLRLAREIMGLIAPLQYSPMFEKKDTTGAVHDRLSVCAAIIDWADLDEGMFDCNVQQTAQARSAGVEDAYYQLLPTKPYRRKNAPYDSLDELRMIRGVNEDFWATFIDPEPDNPKKRIMTVWGQGAVNVNTANAQTLLAIVCSGAQADTAICNDPMQAATFLTGVTMARGLTMGAPMFGNANDFINTMKGQGQMGPLLTTMGMKPVKFQSDAEFGKSISTESKVFSIYTVGVIKGYKRETRTSIHAVVDFRSAPQLTGTGQQPGGTAGNPPPTNPPNPGTGSQTPNTNNPATQPSTGGQVVYFRIE